MSDCRLTTLDNPYNPFTQFDEWYQFDEEHHYCTCGYIERIAFLDDDMPDAFFDEEYERAVDEICEINVLGIYKKVTENDYANGKWKPIKLPKEYFEDRANSFSDESQ